MKYYEALRIWNDKMGHKMYCSPRRGTPQHAEVIAIQKGIKAPALAPTPAPAPASITSAPAPASITSAPAPASITSAPAPKPTESFDYDNINRIKRFLKDKLILNKYTLKNRINKYRVIRDRLNELKEHDCLEVKGEGYTIRNIVNLEKKIGTASKYGTIYLTSIPNNLGKFPIASKVMAAIPSNKLETNLMTDVTENIILKGYTKHFNIIYKATSCKDKKIKPNQRLVNYNELSNGDLKMLTAKRNVLENTDDLFNILFQTFISVGTFHNFVGYYHADAHYGNFLYQLNNEVGYYHYIHDGKSFYLKSCPYNIIIYDFGFSKKISNTNNGDRISIHYDYYQIIHAFLNKKVGGWVEIKDLPLDADNNKINDIKNLLGIFLNKSRTTPYQFRADIFTYIIQLFIKYAPKGMVLLNRPSNVLNKNPFYISK